MQRLIDYSAEFISDLRLSDFAPETLVRLLTLYARLYLAMDASWYYAVSQTLGNEEALTCDIKAWERLSQYEMAVIKRELKIRGNDVIAFLKATQICPWFQLIKSKVELLNENRATLTVTHCPTLDAFEQEGKGREKQICHIVEPGIFKGFASAINPDIEVECLKIPPRNNKDEICCKWEFSIPNKS